MNFEQENYELIETFEENSNQLMVMAIEKENYEDIVIINTITKSDFITSDFVSAYKLASSNLVNISENEDQITIINNYKDTTLLVDYLKENSLEFKERIRIAKSFIFQISNYSNLRYSMQKLLISTNQLTMDNNILLFSDYLFLDNFEKNTTFHQLLSSIGETLRLILQLQKESLSNGNSLLDSFVTSLINNETDFTSFNEVYNQFKIILSNQNTTKDEIKYKELSVLENSNKKPKIDLDFIKQQQRAKRNNNKKTISYNEPIAVPVKEVTGVSRKIISEMVKEVTQTVINNKVTANDFIEPEIDEFEEYSIELPNLDESEISYDFSDSELSIEYIEDQSTISEDSGFDNLELDINPNFISDFDKSDFNKKDNNTNKVILEVENTSIKEEVLVNKDTAIDSDSFEHDSESNNLTSDILSILNELTLDTDFEYKKENISKNSTTEIIDNNDKKLQSKNISDKLIESSIENIFDSWINEDSNEDLIEEETQDEAIEEVTNNIKKIVVSKSEPEIKTINKDVDDLILDITKPIAPKIEDTKEATIDDKYVDESVEEELLVSNENKDSNTKSLNHINDLLKRNDNSNEDSSDNILSLDDTKYKEKKSVPIYLYFFILLLLLTFALLTYASTYI